MKKTFKNFKKIVLPVTLIFSLLVFSPATAGATSITKDTATASTSPASFSGTGNAAALSVHANITGQDVISVNISWGSLVYSYTQAGWDPATLTSTGSATWVAQEQGVSDIITIDNRSNVPVTATLAYTQEEMATNFNDVSGTLTPASLALATAYTTDGTTVLETQRKKSSTLSLSGAPTDVTAKAAYTTIGFVTVTIAKTAD